MIKVLKTIGTVLTIASAAQFGKEMYGKYKDEKRRKQLEEVHEFIGKLDLKTLQKAIDTNDNDVLIQAVENIMNAAEAVKVKSDIEELKDDVQEVAEKMFKTVSTVAGKVIETVNEKIDEVVNTSEMKQNKEDNPSYSDFVSGATSLKFKSTNNVYEVFIDNENISVNPVTKKVTFISPENEIFHKTLS